MSVTNPTAFWNFNESSGQLLDDFGSAYPLTDNNTVTAGAGKINGARYFTGSNSEYFNSADAVFRVGDIDYSWAGWVYITNTSVAQMVLAKDFPGDREYFIDVGWPSSGDITFVAFNGSASAIKATTTISNNTWTYIAVYHDAANDLVGISKNGAAFVTTATGGGHGAGGSLANLTFGRRDYTDFNDYVTGRMDAWGFWSGHVLTIGEVGELYNSGAGIEWPFTAGGQPTIKRFGGVRFAMGRGNNDVRIW